MFQNRKNYSIVKMAKVMKVSTSAYYRWLSRKPAVNKKAESYKAQIKSIFNRSKKTYGSPRVTMALKKLGLEINRKTVAKYMKDQGLCAVAKAKYKHTTNSRHKKPIAPDLVKRNFNPIDFGKIWVSDITYIKTTEGWLYLSVIIDLYNREVIGWSMDKNMKANLIISSLKMATVFGIQNKGLIFHSDRGTQYSSSEVRNYLKLNNIKQSMSEGSSYDNAVAESFFHTLKVEEVKRQVYQTRLEAKEKIRFYIEEFYNKQRFHSHNNYLTPIEVKMVKKIA